MMRYERIVLNSLQQLMKEFTLETTQVIFRIIVTLLLYPSLLTVYVHLWNENIFENIISL